MAFPSFIQESFIERLYACVPGTTLSDEDIDELDTAILKSSIVVLDSKIIK